MDHFHVSVCSNHHLDVRKGRWCDVRSWMIMETHPYCASTEVDVIRDHYEWDSDSVEEVRRKFTQRLEEDEAELDDMVKTARKTSSQSVDWSSDGDPHLIWTVSWSSGGPV
jgi:hypothetical protein